MDKTFSNLLRRGGSVLLMSRKPLEIKQISATYRLEAEQLLALQKQLEEMRKGMEKGKKPGEKPGQQNPGGMGMPGMM